MALIKAIAYVGLSIVGTCVIVAVERNRMGREAEHRERLVQPAPQDEIDEDDALDLLILPTIVQLDPFLSELQDAITAADDAQVRTLFAVSGARHPDTMRLDRGLTPLLLAAYVHVRDEEHDRRLREIMRILLHRGAHITQRVDGSGATVMHLLAYQPHNCSVTHRIHFLLNALENYRNSSSTVPLPGLGFDPVLNGTPADGGGGDVFSISVHLLGMRCYQHMLPEDLAPNGDRHNFLRRRRRMLPPGLQDTGAQAAAEFN